MFKTILDWMLPISCVVCQQVDDDYFCANCLDLLPWLRNACKLCACELESVTTQHCGECLIDPPAHDKIIALFKYEFPIPSLITQFKFRRQFYLGTAFGTVLSKKVRESYENDAYPECIIPVPLHPIRLRQRGYNQALEIARSLKKNGLKIEFTATSRVIATLPQTLIDHNDRRKNVANSFLIANDFKCQHVALLDDVVTTGSTLNELTSTLKKQGVKRVDVICVAKAT